MRKIATIMLLMTALVCKGQEMESGDTHDNAFMRKVKEVNSTWSVGFNFGQAGEAGTYYRDIFMLSGTVYGFYLDFGGSIDDQFKYHDDNNAYLFHVGYRLPLTKWLQITPMIGYANIKEKHKYDWDKWRYYNDDWIHKGFDFGAQATMGIKITKHLKLNVHGAFTRFSWHAGIGAELPIYW